MLVKMYGAAVSGIDASLITIEVNLSPGINFSMVGLPDGAVKEAKDRIITAITNSGFSYPHRQVTINLAPADVRKEGSGYDLPLAIGILSASGAVSADHLSEYIIMGELSLDGTIRKINASLSIAIMAKELGYKGFIVPKENAREAAVVDGLEVYGADTLQQVVEFLNGNGGIERTQIDTRRDFFDKRDSFDCDFREVCGQTFAKRALEVAVAGGHNLIMIGSPGSGKSMLAKRIPSIMPRFTFEEALETTKIHSVAGLLPKDTSLLTTRPYRSPHNNVSSTALLGGGSIPKPGEISLAHNGVLFLDELPQFSRAALEELRSPLEDNMISISRARSTAQYPANFMFIAAMNPCPCGYYGNPNHRCTCSEGEVQRYMGRISGPLLDRIDIQVEIRPVSQAELSQAGDGEPSSEIRQRVEAAREIQHQRFADEPRIHCNAQMEKQHCDKYCLATPEAKRFLSTAMDKLNFSARAYFKILKLARTVADLDASREITERHIKEALSFRNLDRASWATK